MFAMRVFIAGLLMIGSALADEGREKPIDWAAMKPIECFTMRIPEHLRIVCLEKIQQAKAFRATLRELRQ